MDKLELIKRNTEEIIGEEELKKLLKEKKEVSVYWGTMPTGSISIAYFFPMLKISDFLNAGLKVKILIADLHATLDGVSWEILEAKSKYYKKAIINILKTIGVNTKKLEFVRGSDIQLNKKYFNDVLRLSMFSSIHDCKKAASEVVKMSDNPKLGNLIYPLMQALDEEYLNADIQFAGLDQRKIMVYARENLPKIGYKQRIEIMSPIIRGLVGEKMSSSIEATKIDLMNNEETVRKKINNAECIEGNSNNGIMALLQYLIMILKEDKKEKFVVERPQKFGGKIEYSNYKEIEKDFINKKLHPLDLKNAVAKEVNILLKKFRENKELCTLHEKAYG
jgi:tyrosyl-tRNA synthetase